MKLLVIVLCLLSERFLTHSVSYKRFYWFDAYAAFVAKHANTSFFIAHPLRQLLVIILPIMLLTGFVYFSFSGFLYGFSGLMMSLALFYYCLGPDNVFYPALDERTGFNGSDAVGAYFCKVNSQLFTVLFCYIIAGPMLVLYYRLISLCTHSETVGVLARQQAAVFEWFPARISAFAFLMVGNFQKGFGLFRQYLLCGPSDNCRILTQCGLKAMDTTEVQDPSIPAAEELVVQATIIALVFVALFTLAAWL